MVRSAPTIQVVLRQFADFVGDSPVLGHNVRFDLSFLQKFGILQYNEVIDTYELAAVLLPTASRYNLAALGQLLGILMPADHRALNDARVTHGVFHRLYEKSTQLPIDLLAEFTRLSEPFEWGANWVFSNLLRARIRQPLNARQVHGRDHGPLFNPPNDSPLPALNPRAPPIPLNLDEIASLLEFGGPFANYFENYELRPQQIEMLRAVCQAFSEGYHLMVEAGTGTGKSFAYLIPAAMWALQNGLRVLVSTNTINLQDQLIKKDIPDLCQALNKDIRAVVLKGRSNYLCPRRLEALRSRTPENVEQMRVLAKVLVWLHEGGNGDRTEINLNGPIERDAWNRISAEDEGCKGEVCMERTGGACPFFQARQSAQCAHIIIVNHALLLADVSTGNRVLPDYHYLVVDEAHHIESATTNALGYRLTQSDVTRLLREMGGTTSGIIGHASTVFRATLKPAEYASIYQHIQRATDLAIRLENDTRQFFQTIIRFMESQRDGQPVSSYGHQERIVPATRTVPYWTDVEVGWEQAADTLQLLANLVAEIYKAFGEIKTLDPEQDVEIEDLHANFGDVHRRMVEIHTNISHLVSDPKSDTIYWANISANNNQIALEMAPLHIGPLMEKFLWHEKTSVIMTSATLTANGEFEYIRSRLNADEADELSVGSPFDYENSALLYIPKDMPEPSDGNFQRCVDQVLTQLSKATGGRLLALFTSYAQLKRTSQAITGQLSEADIQVYEQGEGASPNALLETFREADRAVLLGTRSFWEGVDVPGQALSVLVIVKLPFDVPSDPIVAARSETFEDPFSQYSLPEAILRFRQGFGRLIRTQSDRGVVVVLDHRVLSKQYGKFFIQSLPNCKRMVGSMAELPTVAARWLNM
jgi:ATP-dependent DNA helicase DinG